MKDKLRLALDEIDYRILNILQEDSRIPISKLARQARVSIPTARQRINRMIKEGVIQRFTVLLDPSTILGYDVLIGINVAPASLMQVAEQLRKLDNVIGVYRSVGEYDLLVRLSLSSYTELDEFLANAISKTPGIQSVKTNIIISILKDEPSPRLKPGRGIRIYCAVCGKEIKEIPIKRVVESKEYYLCCSTCANLFDERTAWNYSP